MYAKLLQVRLKDKIMVFEFYNESEGEPFGSRGISVTDEDLAGLTLSDIQNAKYGDGVPIVDTPSTLMETLVKRAYDEYLAAKAEEESSASSIIE